MKTCEIYSLVVLNIVVEDKDKGMVSRPFYFVTGKENNHMTDKLLSELRQNPRDLVVLASWYYKCGMPIISDHEYNILTSAIGDTEVVWDEIDKPVELMQKYGINENAITYKEIGNNEYYNEYIESLYDAGTRSIKPAYDYRDVYERMISLMSITDELCVSLKVDGVSTRNIIENNNGKWNLVASLSRSRESKGFDYTDGMKLAVQNDLTLPDNVGEIHERSGKRVLFAFGEAYVKRSALEYLREKYGMQDTWKTPRSTALSMLRATVYEEDYKYLKFMCFKLSTGSTLAEMFETASEAGLDVVPYEVIKTRDIPVDYKEWERWFNELLNKYHNIQVKDDIEADGIVVAINNQGAFNRLGVSNNSKYNNGMFSCKVGPWGSSLYYSTVKNLLFENEGNTSEFSVVAEIEPVVVSTGNTVSRVNCFNLKILVDNDISIGSRICFEYKSASSVVLVYR